MRTIFQTALVILTLALSGPVDAGEYEEASWTLTMGEHAKAAILFRLAAERGNVDAQLALGYFYRDGYLMPQDDVSAHMWFNLAASRFSASEGKKRDKAAEARDSISAKMTPTQVAEAHRLAAEWKPSPPAPETWWRRILPHPLIQQ